MRDDERLSRYKGIIAAMSETPLEPTQESQPAPKKKFRPNFKKFFLGLLALIVLIALGGLGGYQSAIATRVDTESTAIAQQVTEQYALALVDIASGNYGLAQQRLEFIIENNPSFPEAQQKLAEVMVMSNMSNVPTSTPAPTITPTVDLSGVEEIFQRAKQYIDIKDWPNALANLDSLRRKDSSYRVAEVDGMYYFAFRNYGYDLIVKEGNLEGGMYELTLAERFGPLDSNASGLREGARLYILGASFWGLDWKNAVFYFSQLYPAWPQLWDGTMTASERFRVASISYGDELFAQDEWCAASQQYQNAQTIGNLDPVTEKTAYQAYLKCAGPIETLPPTP